MYTQIEDSFKKSSSYYKGISLVTGIILLELVIYFVLGFSNNLLWAIIALICSVLIVWLVVFVMRIKNKKIRENDLFLLKIILRDNNADNKSSIEQLLEHYRCYLPRTVYSNQFISWLALFVSILLSLFNFKTIEEVSASLIVIFVFSVIFLIIYFSVIFYADYVNRFYKKSGLYIHLESLLSELLFNYENEKFNIEYRLYNKYKKDIYKIDNENIYSLYENRKISRFDFYEYINTIEMHCFLNKFGYKVNCNLEDKINFNEELKIKNIYIDNTKLITKSFFESKNKLINNILVQISLNIKDEKINVLYLNFAYKMSFKEQDALIVKINNFLINNSKNKISLILISNQSVGNVDKQDDVYVLKNSKSKGPFDKNLCKLFNILEVKENKVHLKRKFKRVRVDENKSKTRNCAGTDNIYKM